MTGPTKVVRAIVAERADFWCEVCGAPEPEGQLHHRRPRGMGGSRDARTNFPSNLLWTCARCNTHAIEANRPAAYICGWLVKQGADPSKVPVLIEGTYWYLDDEGWRRHAAEPGG